VENERKERVDVVLPTRGNAPYVAAALESIVAQTFSDWRLAICENGPGDPGLARAVAPYLTDARVAHLVRGVDLGMSANHTAGVEAGSADYVAILHDDDIWDAGFLERRIRFLDEHADCSLVFGRFRTIDDDGTVLARKHVPLVEGVQPPSAFIPVMLRTNVIGMPSLLVRRTAYEAAGAFATGFPMIDYEMWIRIGARAPVGYLDVEDSAWRFHRRQRSARVARWGEAWLAFYDAVERTLAGFPLSLDDRRHLRRQRAAALICASLDSIEESEPAQARRYLSQAVSIRPASLVDPRVGVAALALRLGAPGASGAARLRAAVKRARTTGGPLVARVRTAVRR
jgi:glycosyltransferase involved in cell wall biosynthesis